MPLDSQLPLAIAPSLLACCYDLLASLKIPDSWPEGCELFYVSESKTLVVDYELPSLDTFRRPKEVKFKPASWTFKELIWPEVQIRRMYDDAVCQIALAALYKLFVVDAGDHFAAVVFNGWVRQINKSTGIEVHPCILSVHIKKDTACTLNQ